MSNEHPPKQRDGVLDDTAITKTDKEDKKQSTENKPVNNETKGVPVPAQKEEEEKKQIDIAITEHHHRCEAEDPMVEKKEIASEETDDDVSLPSDFSDKIAKLFVSLSNSHLESSKELYRWAEVLSNGMSFTTTGEALNAVMDDDKGDWGHSVNVNGNKLQARTPKLKETNNTDLTGEKALLTIMNHLKIGAVKQYPLWHSGVWVTLITPKDKDIISLFREISESKIGLGRDTNGLIYSNSSVIIAKIVLRFIMDHLQSVTCVVDAEHTLYDIIKIQDAYPLMLCVLETMYPTGHDFKRACSSPEGNCNYVAEVKLDFRLLSYVNRSAISPAQRTHMLKTLPGSTTRDEVLHYQDWLFQTANSEITISNTEGDEIRFTLKSPSLGEYIDNGQKWITEINGMIDDAVTEDDDHREAVLERYSQSSILRQYDNWIDAIHVWSNVITDREAINKSLDLLSSDDVIRPALFKEIGKYIDRSTISLVGVPAYTCPVCKADQGNTTDTSAAFNNIIPLDVLVLFFTLGERSLTKIAAR